MNKEIQTKLNNVLKAEAEYTMKNEEDLDAKVEKMDILFNFKKILDNYDELEPVLIDYFCKKCDRDRLENYR